MFGPKIKIDKDLYSRLSACAEAAGYSSVDEFVTHILEKEVERIDKAKEDDKSKDEEEVKKRLKGLGYIS